MALEYKTPEEIADQYLLWLKTLKPEVNIDQTDSDWWIRAQVVGGVFSGLYADQFRIADDAFPQTARREALERHLFLYFNEGFTQPTRAVGNVQVTGQENSTVPISTLFTYEPNGNTYLSIAPVNFGAATSALVPVQSVNVGQAQNLLEGAELTISTPPAGVDTTATVFGAPLSDARDVETNEQASTRILTQVRTPLAGGKESDYVQFALSADDSVVSATVIKHPFGFGTVGVVITAGTTDIDFAIDNNEPIVLIPSQFLIDKVQAYIDTQKPLTDCATVFPPASVPIDVTVTVKYSQGTGSTVLSNQTLTQEELVIREVTRAVYKTPPGGRKIGASGFVLASEIEQVLDASLGDEPYTVGFYAQILKDRQVQDLSIDGPNYQLQGNEIAIPNTITVIEL